MSDASIKSRFSVSGMDCAACAAKVDAAVRRLPSVEDVSVSASTGMMTVQHREDPTLVPAMRSQLKGLGYGLSRSEGERSAAGHDDASGLHSSVHKGGEEEGVWWRSPKVRLTAACGAALVLAYGIGLLLPEVGHWAFLLALAVGLVPIARRAISAAFAGTPFSIETLMTIAAVGAILIGETEEAAIVVFLFLVGELLEGVATGRARASIRALTALVPKTALLERESGTEEVPAESLSVGSVILVRPGDRIPADGSIIEGDSAINEAPVTGESTPVRKGPGASVFAGTINTDAVLRVHVTAAAEDNTIARVVRLVEEAQESKAPTERFIDRFSRYYTPAVLVVGALVAILPPLVVGAAWSEWVYKGLAILLIGCPCALVISTPAAIAAALSAGARRGLLMKGGVVLETLGKITAAAFDKTGTLTEGRPVVTDMVAFGHNERQVLSMAAALEKGSNHPLAIAILEKARAEGVPVPPASDLKAVPGKGVSGRFGGESLFLASPQAAEELALLQPEQKFSIEALNGAGKTVSLLLAGNTLAGLIAMRDEPRADAKAGILALKAAGVTPIMLTGDNSRTAAAIAESLGIEPRAQLLPEDKQRIVRELQAQGQIVAKVGDGINDAPALAAANVGIAMGGGTDVALETADAAVLHGRVLDVARMVRLSKAAMANIRQNIAIALGLKAVFLVTTVLGVTGLWPAILADTGATVLVTANAMRLLRGSGGVTAREISRYIGLVRYWEPSAMSHVLRSAFLVSALCLAAMPLSALAHSLEELQAELGQNEQYFEQKNEPAPSFTLQDTDGKPVRLEDLRGKVVVLNFVFVSCTDVCPVHADEVAKAQAMVNSTPMKERVAFVTITTDPKRDTPEVLRSYAGDHGLDPANWQFLTSGPSQPEDTTRKLAEAFGHKFKPTGDGMQLHGVVTHVIDQDGMLRGNFHGLNFQTLNLVTFVNALTNKMVPHEHPEDEASFWDSVRSFF